MEQHTETIKCPQCNAIQEATVLHTYPFWTYVHECENCKYLITESEWELETSTNHENGNDTNRLLAYAANWWNKLTTFKKELYIGRHYSDDTPTPDKINTLYKIYSDWSS